MNRSRGPFIEMEKVGATGTNMVNLLFVKRAWPHEKDPNIINLEFHGEPTTLYHSFHIKYTDFKKALENAMG